MPLPTALIALHARLTARLSAELPDTRWFRIAVGTACLLLAICGLTVYVTDPYCRYHKTPALAPIYRDEYRMIPHMLNTWDYDSLVAGTSMCLNFSLADVRRLLHYNKPIKITAKGCRPATHHLFCDMAFKKREIHNILTTIDIPILAKEPGSHFIPLEPFLYSKSLLHECAYLFNADIVFAANIDTIKAHMKGSGLLNPDLMFASDDGRGEVHYGKERALRAMRNIRGGELQWVSDLKRQDPEALTRRMMRAFEECYLSDIQAHPETQFTVFYAPYSYLCWICLLQEDMLDYLLGIKARVTEMLLAQPNVIVFDFQAEVGIATNLNYYKDTSHFSPEINLLILERIAAGQNRCGPGTMAANAETIRAMARQGASEINIKTGSSKAR